MDYNFKDVDHIIETIKMATDVRTLNEIQSGADKALVTGVIDAGTHLKISYEVAWQYDRMIGWCE